MSSENLPFSLVVQSHQCEKRIDQGRLNFEFCLPSSYLFSSAQFVRLLSVTGLEEVCVVFLSFAALAPFDTSFERHIGVLGPSSGPGPLCLVQGNFIPSNNRISLASATGAPFNQLPSSNLTFHLQIVPVEWANHV